MPAPTAAVQIVRVIGVLPPELWNRLGTKILPKLRAGAELKIGLDFSAAVSADVAAVLMADLRQILQELGLADQVQVQ
ncbi:ATPase AAA [Acidiphilium multivorum AIU301]|nr:ATPase AAA [Acidiphilium multivorum AIU301]